MAAVNTVPKFRPLLSEHEIREIVGLIEASSATFHLESARRKLAIFLKKVEVGAVGVAYRPIEAARKQEAELEAELLLTEEDKGAWMEAELNRLLDGGDPKKPISVLEFAASRKSIPVIASAAPVAPVAASSSASCTKPSFEEAIAASLSRSDLKPSIDI